MDLRARQGSADLARALLQQALTLRDQIGDLPGWAAALHRVAGLRAQQGQLNGATVYYERVLAIEEQLGDTRGRATTLANLAGLAYRRGEQARAQTLGREADLFGVTDNFGALGDRAGMVQAAWLAARVPVPVRDAVRALARLQEALGDAHSATPLLATTALLVCDLRGSGDAQIEDLRRIAVGRLTAAALARGVDDRRFPQWFEAERLNDPPRFLPALNRALIALTDEDDWLFDRQLVEETDR